MISQHWPDGTKPLPGPMLTQNCVTMASLGPSELTYYYVLILSAAIICVWDPMVFCQCAIDELTHWPLRHFLREILEK